MNSKNYWRFQLIFWITLAAFYTIKERGLTLPLMFLQFFSYASLGITTTHVYQRRLHESGFPFHKLDQIIKKIVPTLLLLGLFVAVYDYLMNRFYYQRDFKDDPWYILTLAGYCIDGVVIFLPWFSAFHLYKYGVKVDELDRERMRSQLIVKQAQLESILNKLNPHFLFNTLNTIRWLINKDKEMARLAINELADIMRYTIRTDFEANIALREELTIAKKYLTIEKWRFEETLTFEVQCDEELLDRPVIPFLLTNVVENAIKYGISQLTEPGTISVVARKTNKSLQVEVTNPGGLNDGVMGFGLDSINQLLKHRFGDDSSIELKTESNFVRTIITIQDA
jgi:hypothetical protein